MMAEAMRVDRSPVSGWRAEQRRRLERILCELPSAGVGDGEASGERERDAPGHGSYGRAVVGGCGCELCAGVRRQHEREVQELVGPRVGGRPRYVPADAARRHLAALAEAGVGLKSVAALSGVSHGGLSKIVYGEPSKGRPPSRRIRPDTLERVLAVTLSSVGGGQRVPAGPTWALIEELVAAGHSRASLARELGSQAASPTLQIGRHRVRASTARAVERLHRRLLGDR
ncbi:MAG: hypothetical protein ACLGIO_00945 [Acidimicrobiia bacterium]